MVAFGAEIMPKRLMDINKQSSYVLTRDDNGYDNDDLFSPRRSIPLDAHDPFAHPACAPSPWAVITASAGSSGLRGDNRRWSDDALFDYHSW